MLIQHYLSFLVTFLGGYRAAVLQFTITCQVIFHLNFSHDNNSSQVVDKEKVGFRPIDGWTHPSSMTIFVHLFIRSVIGKGTIVT